jgi:hypothetical protein
VNALMNAVVPRKADWKNKPVIKNQVVQRITETARTQEQKDTSMGLSRLLMIGKNFGGNKELFDEAKDAGEIYKGDDDGLWYYDSRSKSKSKQKTEKGTLSFQFKCKTAEELAFRSKLDRSNYVIGYICVLCGMV